MNNLKRKVFNLIGDEIFVGQRPNFFPLNTTSKPTPVRN